VARLGDLIETLEQLRAVHSSDAVLVYQWRPGTLAVVADGHYQGFIDLTELRYVPWDPPFPRIELGG
jgi:hypothetical protein